MGALPVFIEWKIFFFEIHAGKVVKTGAATTMCKTDVLLNLFQAIVALTFFRGLNLAAIIIIEKVGKIIISDTRKGEDDNITVFTKPFNILVK